MAKDLKKYYAAKNASLNSLLKEFTGWSTRDLVQLIAELRLENESLLSEIETLNAIKAGETKKAPLPVFKKTWSVSNKLHYLLLASQKPMRLPELLAEMHRIDKNFKFYEYPNVVLATYLGRLAKSGRFIRIKLPGVNTFYYALPEWMNEDNKLKAEYKASVGYFLD